MRKRWLVLLIIAPILVVSTGCDCRNGNGGSNQQAPPQTSFEPLQECSLDGMRAIGAVFGGLLRVLVAVDTQGEVQPLDGSYDWNTGQWTVEVDFDFDGVNDGQLSGTVRNLAGVQDGISINEVCVLEWAVSQGDVTGDGVMSHIRLSQDIFRVTLADYSPVLDRGGCEFEVNSFGIHVDPYTLDGDFEPFGTMEFTSRYGGDLFTGLFVILDGAELARVNGTYDSDPKEFYVDLETWEIVEP